MLCRILLRPFPATKIYLSKHCDGKREGRIINGHSLALLVPSVIPLMGMFMLGNLMKESGVVGRLTDTAQGSLMNMVTIFLGISVGATMHADRFLSWKPLFIFSLGLVDFAVCTIGGILITVSGIPLPSQNRIRRGPPL